jgi:signal transduction histidine kinase
MQDYSYSAFSLLALVLHVLINFKLMAGRRAITAHGARYRGFLLGVLAYYVTDAAWGILAGLAKEPVWGVPARLFWTRALYVETAFFFLALAAFVFMWCRFVTAYLGIGRRAERILSCYGWALLAFNLAALVANPFNNLFYSFDAQGVYQSGRVRELAFVLLIAFDLLLAAFVYAKALRNHGPVRRRNMMVFLFCIVLASAIALQLFWPLTPFTALGCLVSNCFFHIFVVQDEQMSKHAAALEKALEGARAAEKARSLFFSIVSHDIRTPLNAILGYSELLQYGVKSPSERDEAIASIRASGRTLLELVNDVLDLAKMDAGKLSLQPEPVRLGDLADEVFSSFRLAAERKGLALVNRTGNLPTLLLDAHRFRQILFNLVGNAVKFTEHGSVTISAIRTAKGLEVSVADTGCGIPRDMQRSILDPFVQVRDPSHSADRAGGTGLGLSICRRLVEMMGGELLVESEPGKGSTFTARIPGVADAAAPDGSPAPVAAPAPAATAEKWPERVLVVDDSPLNRKVLVAFLKRAGIEAVDQAGDGAEALAKLDEAAKAGHPHDFVFTDFWMPNMSGIEFVEKLRANSLFGCLPVYAVTADTEFQRDGRTSLFTGILFKPVTYAKLAEMFTAEKA